MRCRHSKNLKNATLAELEEAAASWRDTLENYQLEEVYDPCMGEFEFSEWGTDDVTVDDVESDREQNIQICHDIEGDIEEYAKVEVLRIKARDKAKKKKAA